MFLSSMYDTASPGLGGDDAPAKKAAIEAELQHLPDFSGSGITVEVLGESILVDGVVENEADFSRSLQVAKDIAGEENVIFRVGVASQPAG